jgi:hypothetical protein
LRLKTSTFNSCKKTLKKGKTPTNQIKKSLVFQGAAVPLTLLLKKKRSKDRTLLRLPKLNL